MVDHERRRWLLLIHALPPRPLYLRARVRRELARAGAAPLKKSVYALPHSEEGHERLRAIVAEIRAAGAFAIVCEATFDDDEANRTVVASYNQELHAHYRAWMDDAAVARGGSDRSATSRRAGSGPAGRRRRGGIPRLRARLEALNARDRFQAPGARQATALLADLESAHAERTPAQERKTALVGLSWVTRKGVLVDRVACVWVVRRFIDPSATFRFVAAKDAAVVRGEIGFDMPGAAIGHASGACSVESLVRRAKLEDPAVRRIAEIVHDLDLRDGRYGHPETAGFEHLLLGTIAMLASDDERLARGLPLFDALYAALARGATLVGMPTMPVPRIPPPSPPMRSMPRAPARSPRKTPRA